MSSPVRIMMNENDEKSVGNDLRVLSTLVTSLVPRSWSHFVRKGELEKTAIHSHLKAARAYVTTLTSNPKV